MRRLDLASILLTAGLVTPAWAQSCTPVDPTTGEQCVREFRVESNVQFKDLYWENACDFDVLVEWKSDKMVGSVWVNRRSENRRGLSIDQCYFYCGEVAWSSICKGIPQNAMSVRREGAPSENPATAAGPDTEQEIGAQGANRAPRVSDQGEAPSAAASATAEQGNQDNRVGQSPSELNAPPTAAGAGQGSDDQGLNQASVLAPSEGPPPAMAAGAGQGSVSAGAAVDLNPVSSIAAGRRRLSAAVPARAHRGHDTNGSRSRIEKVYGQDGSLDLSKHGKRGAPSSGNARSDIPAPPTRQCPPDQLPFLGSGICVHCFTGRC